MRHGLRAVPSNAELVRSLEHAIARVFVGKKREVRFMLVGFIAGLHVLIEDVPGVGKTTLARVMAASAGVDFARIQFTPDLLPGDITGMTVWDNDQRTFVFKQGAIMHQFILADEINRASPRTQSSLLEAMQEGSVTVEGITHRLPQPFFVIATQNPVTFVGVFHLPEGELDRFGISFSLGYPTDQAEKEILDRFQSADPFADLGPVTDPQEIMALRAAVRQVRVDDSIKSYVIALAARTRENPLLKLGASPRCSQHVLLAAQAYALADGREFVIPEDVRAMLPVVVPHRLVLSAEARIENLDAATVLQRVASTVPVPTGVR